MTFPDDMLKAGAIQKIASNSKWEVASLVRAHEALNAAQTVLATGNNNDAVALAHTATRQALVAMMNRDGYRAAAGEGGHRRVIEYAAARPTTFDQKTADDLDRLRRYRNTADYGAEQGQPLPTADAATQAVALAGRVVRRVENVLGVKQAPADAAAGDSPTPK
jgi:HEPN domain-containing protein